MLDPATILFIGLLLGWDWAALRLVLGVALVSGLSAATARFMPAGTRVPAPPAAGNGARAGLARAYGAALRRLTVRLLPEYAVLVFALGAVRRWLFPPVTPMLRHAGGHATWSPLALALVGTLFVIPTAGEVCRWCRRCGAWDWAGRARRRCC